MSEELLPKPQTDLPKPDPELTLPEKEISEHAAPATPASKGEAFRSYEKPSILRSKFLWSFVAISFLVAFLIGGFVLGKNTNKQSPLGSPKPTAEAADPTADWQTYTSPQLGFSIKYPPNYSLKEESNPQYSPGIDLIPNDILNNSTPLTTTYRVSIAVVQNDKHLSLLNPKGMFGKGPLIGYVSEELGNTPVNKIMLDNYEAYRVNGCCGGQVGVEADILTVKNNQVFEINVAPYQIEGNQNKNKQLYEQILSTFKFTE
ncbi:MAG: hypothetical protein HY426_03400 [Candidatus Levybacteria bacterium]|nr:hypothetical protein [Candidatus Levybacteria bacterium]